MPSRPSDEELNSLTPDDVVIVPAFGAETAVMEQDRGARLSIVDTTCGDVMSVWRRVREYAKNGRTSIIHGKATHEETRATATRALGEAGGGHYLVILTLADCDCVCDYIRTRRRPRGVSETFRGRLQRRASIRISTCGASAWRIRRRC